MCEKKNFVSAIFIYFLRITLQKNEKFPLRQWIRLNKSFLYVVLDLSQPSRSCGKLNFRASAQDVQSICSLDLIFVDASYSR